MKHVLHLSAIALATLVTVSAATRTTSSVASSPSASLVGVQDEPALALGEGCIDPVITTRLASLLRCIGDTAVFQVEATGTDLQYEWSHGFVVQPQYTTHTVVINPVTLQDRGIWCVRVYNVCGEATSCTRLSVVACGGTFCTLTQGAYGSAGGAGNLAQITNLLASGDLVVGELGVRSVTIQPGQARAQCIIDRLPAGGPPAALPNFGDQVLGSGTCQTATPLPLMSDGRWRNNMLGQTVTLALNLRGDPSLGILNLCSTMTTDEGVVSIPQSVVDGMPGLGFGHTVGGLLGLANRALAGGNLGAIPFADVHTAVEAINSGFDECVTLVDCD